MTTTDQVLYRTGGANLPQPVPYIGPMPVPPVLPMPDADQPAPDIVEPPLPGHFPLLGDRCAHVF